MSSAMQTAFSRMSPVMPLQLSMTLILSSPSTTATSTFSFPTLASKQFATSSPMDSGTDWLVAPMFAIRRGEG